MKDGSLLDNKNKLQEVDEKLAGYISQYFGKPVEEVKSQLTENLIKIKEVLSGDKQLITDIEKALDEKKGLEGNQEVSSGDEKIEKEGNLIQNTITNISFYDPKKPIETIDRIIRLKTEFEGYFVQPKKKIRTNVVMSNGKKYLSLKEKETTIDYPERFGVVAIKVDYKDCCYLFSMNSDRIHMIISKEDLNDCFEIYSANFFPLDNSSDPMRNNLLFDVHGGSIVGRGTPKMIED